MKTILISLVLLTCSLLAGCGIKVDESLNDEGYIAVPLRNTLAAGHHHTMAIANDGSLWAWGSNSHGQVGDGTTENRFSPVKVLDNVSMVIAHNNSSMALQYDGTLWAWGDNSSGLLGDGTTVNRTKPTKVMENVIHIAMSDKYTLIVKSDGSLWGLVDLTDQGTGVWKQYPPFYLNDITVNDAHSPAKLIESGVKYASVSGGHLMIIKEDNTLWGWGSNIEGELGVGFSHKGELDIVLEPTLITENVAYVFTELGRTTVVTIDGKLWAWGIDYKLTGTKMLSDVPVMLMDNIAAEPNSFQFGIAVTADNELIGWGFEWYYDERIVVDPETGARIISTVESPLLLMENVTEMVMSPEFTIVKTINNEVWAWGNNNTGQLGISDILNVPPHSPVKVMDLSSP